MRRRRPRSTRTVTLFPYTVRFRSLDARLAAAREAGDAIGAGISAHGDASEALAQRISGDVADIQEQLELLDVSVPASSGVIGKAIEDTKGQLETFMAETTKSNSSAHQPNPPARTEESRVGKECGRKSE